MSTPNAFPFDLFSKPDFPAVTLKRVREQLSTPEMNMFPEDNPDFPDSLSAHLNNLKWVISAAEDLVKLECLLPTTLSYEDVSPVFHVIANEHNASAFDGRALVGRSEEDTVELRGDATFVTTAGMNDEQLFHALNLAVIAAQNALLSTLDRFNEFAHAVQESES